MILRVNITFQNETNNCQCQLFIISCKESGGLLNELSVLCWWSLVFCKDFFLELGVG